MVWSNVLERLKNDFHVPIALLVLAVTSFMHFKSHVDLGANYVNSLYAFYAFLAGDRATGMWGKVKGSPDDSPAPTSSDSKS